VEGEPVTPATITELPEEQALFREAWDILKRYRHIQQPERESWAALVQELETLSGIGEGTPCGDLSRAVAMALADYLERQSKEGAKMAI
jgi:hypothetical protein